jgi:hypothetical protein
MSDSTIPDDKPKQPQGPVYQGQSTGSYWGDVAAAVKVICIRLLDLAPLN